MTITEAKKYLKTLINESSKSREIKVYKKFLDILTSIESRGFTAYQLELIEKELTILNLNKSVKNKRRYIKQQLGKTIKYLESEHSLILEGHYASLGMSFGLVFGMLIGTTIFRDSLASSTGMCFGLFIGLLIGKYMDNEAAKQKKVLKLA